MKSHFTFSRQDRNGIFLLIGIIIVLQSIYYFVDFPSEDIQINNKELALFIKELDSLKELRLKESEYKVYTFNPNYLSDFKGASIGMSNEEIDRLISYRKQNKWINSAEQFQEVTQISDSLLLEIKPLFKFPNRVKSAKQSTNTEFNKFVKSNSDKIDLNTATVLQLQKVNGVGEVLANRIVRFRNKFPGGFINNIQLQDVYGLSEEVIIKINNKFVVKTPRKFDRVHLNTATINQLVTIQHIDYDLAKNIIEYRVFNKNYKKLDELLKVKDFPINKFDIIKLYLLLD